MTWLASIALACEGGWLYWTDRAGRVERIDDAGTREVVVADAGHPWGLAVMGDVVVWGDHVADTLSTPQGVLETGVAGPFGVTWDRRRRLLVWLDQDAKTVRARELAGQAWTVFSDVGDGSGRGTVDIAVDDKTGWLYWTELSSRVVERGRIDGSKREVIAREPDQSQPYGIAVDPVGERVVWTDFTRGYVRQAGLDGSNVHTVGPRAHGHYAGIAVDPGGALYIGASHPNRIERWTGTDVQVIVDLPGSVGDMVRVCPGQ